MMVRAYDAIARRRLRSIACLTTGRWCTHEWLRRRGSKLLKGKQAPSLRLVSVDGMVFATVIRSLPFGSGMKVAESARARARAVRARVRRAVFPPQVFVGVGLVMGAGALPIVLKQQQSARRFCARRDARSLARALSQPGPPRAARQGHDLMSSERPAAVQDMLDARDKKKYADVIKRN